MFVPPGTTFQSKINDLICALSRHACMIQKHTKRTLFRVFAWKDSWVQHCVSNLVKERSSFDLLENDLTTTFWVSKGLRSQSVYEDICNWALFRPNFFNSLLGGKGI